MQYKLSSNGLNLIKNYEGCRLTAYKCVANEKYYTIGYGHYGIDVTKGMKITQAQADDLLKQDIQKYVDIVNNCINGYGIAWINQNRFDALVSFTYNCGKGNLVKLLNEGKRNSAQVSSSILLYNKSGGKVLEGLNKRRKSEKLLFDTPVVKTDEEIAQEVIEGKWGNGAARRIKLSSAGYDYFEIQKLVNEILRR